MRQLIEKVELHDTLNPKIWENDKLKTEVKDKLEEIIDQFILELHDNDIPVKVLDARLVGSNASFNYTENSDMDVHLIVNTQEASCDTNVLTLLYNYFKSNFNDKYDISIHGIPVELYIEDVGASAVSNGIYSIYDDEWIKYPEPVEVPDIDITDDFAVLERRYKNIIEDNDAEEAEELLDELYLRRKDSLATEGEYGKDNLLFKQFRSEGYLDGLKEVINGITSKELSLEALMEDIHEDDDTYYRVEIRTSDGYQGGLFHTIDRVFDTEDEYDIDSAEYELDYLIGELEDMLGYAPEINNRDAIFAYKEDEFLKIYDTLHTIQGLLEGFEAELIIRKIHNPKKIEYEDDKQVAVVESLTEDLKTKEWVVDKFSKAFLKYMPNMPSSKLMLQAKLKDLDEGEWKKIVDFVNSLSFPLTVYRGLKLENEDTLDVKDLGVNWTVDDTLFFAPNSSFKNSNYIIKGQITEDDVDWEETIQNFVYYSLRPRYGFYPENEVTLKKNFTLQNPELFRKDGNSLVLVKALNESLVVESRNHMDIEEMIEQAYYRHPKPEEIFEEPWDELVDPKQFYSDLTKGTSPEYKARARKQILMNTEKDLIYNVLLGYLDSLGTGNTDYMKLEPAIAKKIDGKIVPQDGGHRAILCKMLGMKLPVKFVETYQESVDRTVYNALHAFPKYVEKYGEGSALFELKYRYNLQDDELVWIMNKLIDSGRIDMFTRDSYISQLGLEDYEDDIKKVIEEDYLDDEEKFWDYHTSNISGNQVFDETTQESSYGKKFLDLAKSGKSDSKGRKAKIIKMTPMQYFEGCALGFGTSVQSQIRQVKNDKGTLDLLNDVIDKYHKRFPITYLDFSGTTFGQEGRHRMYIAGERYGWDTKFPVLVIYSGNEPDYGKYKRMGYDNEEDEEIETVDIDIDDIDLEDLAIFEAIEEFGDTNGIKLFL